jgi:hypothetical protein
VISHTIYLINGDKKTPVLESMSDSASQPCFTELHQQGEMLFLTGADGPCHWSMSVESRQDSDIVFDIACRIKEPSLELRTEYSVLTRSDLRVAPYDESTRVEADDSSLRIASIITAPTTVPATVRWKYGIFPAR